LLWAVGAAVALLLCYALCQRVFFELHGNKQWPSAMFILGLAVIIIAAFPAAKKVLIYTVVGYVFSFIIGLVFNSEYDYIVDGVAVERHYTAWQIWTVAYLVIIVASVV
jgi:hypothetical protein